jgi:hypothetical protein
MEYGSPGVYGNADVVSFGTKNDVCVCVCVLSWKLKEIHLLPSKDIRVVNRNE